MNIILGFVDFAFIADEWCLENIIECNMSIELPTTIGLVWPAKE